MSRIEQNINLSRALRRGSTNDGLEGEVYFLEGLEEGSHEGSAKDALGDGARDHCLKGRAEDCSEG